ncbi:TonB-dependent receptor domain-containing protein [Winogradskyella vincentii]|nr:TonB-dependent receptor [Winogradskyella vincentii]
MYLQNTLLNRAVMTLMLVFLSIATYAQNKIDVQLLDITNSSPIVGATFKYSNQNGITDNKGNFSFNYEKGQTLYLSHINYSEWSLDDAEVLNLKSEKTIYKAPVSINLQPVTVISLRSKKNPSEDVELEYRDQLAHDAAAILNKNPSINSIVKGGAYGFDPVFRGYKYDQLNVVLNGAQSATAACPNRMDPPTSQMAPNMLNRIEILKGPYVLRYGTGFGATINFIPEPLNFTEKNDIYGRVSSGYDGNGNILRNEGLVGLSGKTHDVTFFSSWSQGENYTTGNDDEVVAGFNRGSFGTNLGIKLNETQQLRLSAVYNIARDADFAALPMDLRKDDTWLFNLRHDVSFNKKHLSSLNTTAFASFVDHLMDNLMKPLDPRMLNAQTNATTYNFGGRSEGIWYFDNSKLFAGADFRKEGADGTRDREFLMGPNAGNTISDNVWLNSNITKTSLFAEYQFNINKTKAVLSSRLEFNSGEINNLAEEFEEVNDATNITQFNPSFSFGLTRKLGTNASLGLWVARAQRSGGLTERYINYFPVGQDPYELVGNPQLNPEINNQIDITFNWQDKTTIVNVDLFAGYLQDFISSYIDPNLTPRLPMSPGVRRFTNIKDAFKTGFEINWQQEILENLEHQAGIAYTYAEDLERDEPLPEIAPLDFRYTLSGNYLKGKLFPELTFRYVLEQSRISSEFGETETPAFSKLDFRVAYQFSKSGKLTGGINNLFDEYYYEHLSRSVRGENLAIYAPGRNAYVSVNFMF